MNLIMKEKILPLTDENFKETTTKELMALILSLPDHCDMKNLMFQKIKLILEY